MTRQGVRVIAEWLYDCGMRSDDKEVLKSEYELTSEEVAVISEKLKHIEGRKVRV